MNWRAVLSWHGSTVEVPFETAPEGLELIEEGTPIGRALLRE